MKKYFIKFTALILFVGIITSCDEKEVIYDGNPIVANFATNFGGLNELENTPVTANIVVNVSATSSVSRTIKITVDPASTATQNQYQIDVASLVIPANSYSGAIKVTSDFNALPTDGSVNLILNLDEVGDPSINIDSPKATFTLALQRSCPFDISKVGTNFSAAPFVDGDAFTVYTPKMTQNAVNPNLFTVNSLWGPTFVADITGNSGYINNYLYAGTILINEDLSLTIKGVDSWATGGSGSYNPCNNTFTYTLANTLFTDPFLTTVVLTPN